ncbi:hypothetical protein OC861_004965 [Tilletia horrida]|nr:hypothetical protein OC861_004965 [Tilletia horrida]
MASLLNLIPSPSLSRAKKSHIAARDAALTTRLSIEESAGGEDLHAVSLGSNDVDILSADIASLTSGIQDGKWTATDILAVYIRSARRAQARLNCLTEVLFESAIEKAAKLDDHFAATKTLIGPLHGVPISLKDHIPAKGSKATLGFSSWIAHPPSRKNATIVNVLEHLGAVPFVKTHIPQTMIAFESQTPLFGTTKNPYLLGHTSGGSSGGEGALLAADGSVVGVGSDIGGSLRIPAGYCGIYTLKPTDGRWTKQNLVKYSVGFTGINSVIGPMGRTAADVQLVFNSVVAALQPPPPSAGIEAGVEYDKLMKELDFEGPTPAPIRPGWEDPLAFAKARGRKLRIGYIYTDGFVKTSPACLRAVHESVEALRAKLGLDLELVRVPASKVRGVEGFNIFSAILGASGHYAKTAHIRPGREWPIRPIWMTVYLTRFPRFMHWFLAFIVKWVLWDRRISQIVRSIGMKSTIEYEGWIERKADFIGRWNEEVWEGMKVDAILAPVHATPAVAHNATGDLSMISSGTTLYNLMDNAVATLTVTRVDSSLDSHRPPQSKSPKAAAAWRRWKEDDEVQRECSGFINYNLYSRGRYDAKKMHGLPVGVQVIARPHAEETALGVMRLLDDALPKPAERGGRWNVDGKTAKPANGFGPGTYTAAVYGTGKK